MITTKSINPFNQKLKTSYKHYKNMVNQYEEWLVKFKNAWQNRNPKEAANLFSKDAEYYESALGEKCKNWRDILKLWKVVPNNQKNVTFSFSIISLTDKFAVINFQVSRIWIPNNKKQSIDGIFLIKLNKDGLCNYFRQWRTVKED